MTDFRAEDDSRNALIRRHMAELIVQGRHSAAICLEELNAVLEPAHLTPEVYEAVCRKITDLGIRLETPGKAPSRLFPTKQSLRAAYAHNPEVLQYLDALPGDTNLESQKEAELVKKMLAGDSKAGDALVEGNLLRVASIALNYTGRGFHVLDLLKEGNDALVAAVKEYPPEKTWNFSTWSAWKIRWAMSELVEKADCPPVIELDAVNQALEQQEMPRDPERTTFTRDELRQRIREVRGKPVSPEDWEMLCLYFGADDGKRRSLREMAQLGYDPQSVRRAVNRNLRICRGLTQSRRVREFFKETPIFPSAQQEESFSDSGEN